jgi:hypothetical protein
MRFSVNQGLLIYSVCPKNSTLINQKTLRKRRISPPFSLSLSLWERAGVRVRIQQVIPHPNPLPEGEGT